VENDPKPPSGEERAVPVRAVGLARRGLPVNLTGKFLKEMHMPAAATTTLSSKGQVVIPEEIRLQLGLEPGVRFVVIADRDVVIFKRLDPPSLGEFNRLVTRARQVARQTGMTRAEVTGAVKKARHSR
jgi:AbrB family looped-hinge helix DNA binding protein